jgi:hypothetical protein
MNNLTYYDRICTTADRRAVVWQQRLWRCQIQVYWVVSIRRRKWIYTWPYSCHLMQDLFRGFMCEKLQKRVHIFAFILSVKYPSRRLTGHKCVRNSNRAVRMLIIFVALCDLCMFLKSSFEMSSCLSKFLHSINRNVLGGYTVRFLYANTNCIYITLL